MPDYEYKVFPSLHQWRWPVEMQGEKQFDYDENYGDSALVVEAFHKATGEHVGSGIFLRGQGFYVPDLVYVRQDHLRKGIATTIWRTAQANLPAGYSIVPDDRLTDDGRAFLASLS